MKNLILLLLAFTVSATMYGQNGKLDKVKSKLDPASIAGLNVYDADELFKALKIKKSSKKGELIGLINNYNENIEQLKGENMGILVKLGSDLKGIFSNKDFSSLWDARSDFKDQVSAVRAQSKVYHDSFEKDLVEVLKNRKQKKWYKYQDLLRTNEESEFKIGDIFSYVGM